MYACRYYLHISFQNLTLYLGCGCPLNAPGIIIIIYTSWQMPKASDELLIQKLYSSHQNKSSHFVKPRLSTTAFSIHHYAGLVEYESEGVVEKNVDSVIEEHITVLRKSRVFTCFPKLHLCSRVPRNWSWTNAIPFFAWGNQLAVCRKNQPLSLTASSGGWVVQHCCQTQC